MKFMNVIKKFTSQQDYVDYRNKMLDDAAALLNEGKMDEYKAMLEDVETLDTEYKDYTEAQANAAALRGSISLGNVVTTQTRDGVVATINNDADQADKKYRMAFMNYVLSGKEIPNELKDAAAYTTTSDVGAVIPNTILDRIVEKMEVTGTILNKVTRTYFKGGVTVPTSTAKPTATWTTERGVVDPQKKTLGSITFAYHKLKVVVAVSLAVENVTLEVFERTISNNIAEAMVKALEEAIIKGEGAASNQPKGILKETALTGQVVEITEGNKLTYADICKAEGALPSAYDKAEWYMSKSTYYSQVIGMVDSNGQPVARTSVGLNGKPEPYILGRAVNFTEYVADFATSVAADTDIAFIFNMEDYLLNTNLNVTVKQYEDDTTDDKMTKAIMLADGKAIDINSLVKVTVKNS